jgi:hypothetical protein
MLSTLFLLVTPCAVFLLLKLCTVCYNLFFHPLRKVPGPKIAAATDLYKIYFDLIVRGGLLAHIETLHKKYGTTLLTANSLDSVMFQGL